ncbi:MAG: TMEM175 family protein [Actinomycetota bacterium]|nr:TMEM175 family protein [Actinomycetota bacterium]
MNTDGGAEKELPRLERGRDLSRIFAFSDGVFAIAITLLVLQIDVPAGATDDSTLWSALGDESPNLIAFAISFAVIGMYWVNNHRFMRTVVEYDRGLMLLTLGYLFFVVLLPFTSQLMGEYGSNAPISIAIYIVNLLMISVVSVFMQRHVLREKLGKPEYDWDTELGVKSTACTAVIMLLTIPLAFVFHTWALFFWLLLKFDPWQRERDRIYREKESPPKPG